MASAVVENNRERIYHDEAAETSDWRRKLEQPYRVSARPKDANHPIKQRDRPFSGGTVSRKMV
jgi:hypothetical protein